MAGIIGLGAVAASSSNLAQIIIDCPNNGPRCNSSMENNLVVLLSAWTSELVHADSQGAGEAFDNLADYLFPSLFGTSGDAAAGPSCPLAKQQYLINPGSPVPYYGEYQPVLPW
jgi:hypothetical protein